jgi:signal peptidase I
VTDIGQGSSADRLAPPPANPSDVGPRRRKRKGKRSERRHPWRDNIEAITMAIVMAVMLKYFIIEAYRIPTGSMQPTLMGNKEVQIFDRILVDKLSYHFRDPKRFEVVVFKYPLDSSKNFIKRLVGVGPEELRILNGDLWHRSNAGADWRILRRPRPIQQETWKPLHPGQMGPQWKTLPGPESSWTLGEGELEAQGPGSMRYPPTGSVMDNYLDGYPLPVFRRMRGPRGDKVVGDLRVDGEIRAELGCTALEIEFLEGERRYSLRLPGPAAADDERPRIRMHSLVAGGLGREQADREVVLDEAWRLPADRWIRFGAQNLDDLVSLEIGEETRLELEVPPVNPNHSSVQLHLEGDGARMRSLMVYRDVYYTTDRVRNSQWVIPEGQYVMLGDNTQDSSDSREWQWARYRWPGVEGVLRGNLRKRDPEVPNPWFPSQGGERRIWFRDEWGELYHAPWGGPDSPEELEPEYAPMVPRELVTGRALVVFWPLRWDLRLWRLRWIH